MSTIHDSISLLLYGIAAGESERYNEQLLSAACRTELELERIQALAAADGWHSFRVAGFIDGERPDFAKAVRGVK